MKAASVDAAQQHFGQTVASLLGTPFGEGVVPEIHAFGKSNYEDGYLACVEVFPCHSHLMQGKSVQKRSEDRFFAWTVAEWPSMTVPESARFTVLAGTRLLPSST